jgi:alpha-beta hydrolase superfamily lysophospholipase
MQWFAGRNIASFAVDFRGHGRSAGKPGFVRKWDEHLTDLAKFLAIDELSTTTNRTPLFILAHSHGGLVATVAAATGMLNHCRGVILSAPYLDLKMPVPLHKHCLGKIAALLHPSMQIKSGMTGNMLTRDPQMDADTKADPFCRGIATPGWYFSALKTQLRARAMTPRFKLPLLMLVPGQDSIANPAASVDFFERCASKDKTILHYPEHRHELLRELGREEIFGSIMKWIFERMNLT